MTQPKLNIVHTTALKPDKGLNILDVDASHVISAIGVNFGLTSADGETMI